MAWWQRAFKSPLVVFESWMSSCCGSIWSAMLVLLGLETKESPNRSTRSWRRMLLTEGLESRNLMAGVYENAVLADAPTAYYRLGDTPPVLPISDASGHGLTGTLLNTISLGQSGALTGDANSSSRFSASGNGALIADNNLLTPGTFATFEAWIKPDQAATGQFQNLLSKRDYTGGLGFEYQFVINPSGLLHFDRSLDGFNNAGIVTSNVPVASGVWQHVAVTVQNGFVTLFINGTVVGGGNGAGGPSANTGAPVQIGTAIGATSNFQYRGQIDEVATYGTALSTAQILSHYQSAATGTYSTTVLSHNPIAYWRLGKEQWGQTLFSVFDSS